MHALSTLFRLALLCSAAALFCLYGAPAAAQETAAAPPSFKEYFVDLAPDTALLIRMEGFEAEFETRVYGPENVLMKVSGLPGLRMGPIFQFIDPAGTARQLRVQVVIGGKTDRYRIEMRPTKYDQNGPDVTQLTRAYRLLSSGLEVETSRRAEAWTMKVVSLNQAAHIFDQLGMQEMQLWSMFFGHYLLLQLGDPVTAAEGARDINLGATRSRLQPLKLAALQLEAQALSRQRSAGTTRLSDAEMARVQELFRQAIELAEQLDLQYERALAMFFSGVTYQEAARNAEAFKEYGAAIEVASASGDDTFANQIRKRAADLHESLGQNVEAIALMREISANAVAQQPEDEEELEGVTQPEASKASAERSEREMANYLFEQGRLLEKTYRYTEAVDVLYQALEQNSAAVSDFTGPIGLQLARALFATGQTDEALPILQEALARTSAARYGRAVQEGYGLLAEIQRGRRNFDEMVTARERQSMFFPEGSVRAAFVFEKALDALASEGPKSSSARALLREAIDQSKVEAANGGSPTVSHMAELQLCALGNGPGVDVATCAGPRGQQALSFLTVPGLPRLSMQARLWWWQILRQAGQSANASLELDRLIEDMRFFQLLLPGVLGSWYWQHRDEVFDAWMAQTLANADASGERAFTELARLQGMGQEQASSEPDVEVKQLNDLRSLYAEREAVGDPQVARSLDGEISQATKALRAKMPGRSGGAPDFIAAMRQWSDTEGFLTYYFTAREGFAWLGTNKGLRLVRFAWSSQQAESLSRGIEALRWDASKASAPPAGEDFIAAMDRLGEMLIAPLGEALPEVIYFLPSGRLEGVPLDALRQNGAFLAARHRVVYLVAAQGLSAPHPTMPSEATQNVFLGGRRLEQAGDFSLVQQPSAEVAGLADLFVGPGLSIRQGAALQWDEIHNEKFTGAGLVHMAVPCTVDLRDPARSSLLLSDNTDNPAQSVLSPANISALTVNASLVVLSACDFAGTNTSQFARNTRFPGEFLRAGAGAVVASQWSPGDAETAEFMGRFYGQLQVQPDIGLALWETKKSYLAAPAPGDAWAAFQLYTH